MELKAKTIRYELDAEVAWITLAAPQTGNALNAGGLTELHDALLQANNDAACRVIVIAAEGNDYCKGLDLQAAFANGSKPDPTVFERLADCLQLIRTSRLPVIASVEGNVTGGGAGLVAACDLVLATEHVHFVLPEVVLGLLPALITPFLLRRLSPGRVRFLALSSRSINAPEAHIFGLVDEIATEGMTATLDRQLQRILRSSPAALAECKDYFCELDALVNGSLRHQADVARRRTERWITQPEVIAGVQTFCEGFSPQWWQRYQGHKNERGSHD